MLLGLFLTGITAASGVNLGIQHERDGRLLLVNQQVAEGKPKVWQVEAQNRGSIPFTGRVRLDITNAANKTVYRTWSDVFQLEPGAATGETLGFYAPQRNESLTAHIVMDYGVQRITKTATFNTTRQKTQEGFELLGTAVYKDHAVFRIAVPKEVDAFYLTLDGKSTRRFAQQRVKPSSRVTAVRANYNPPIPETEEAQLTISGSEGKYHYTDSVKLERKTGLDAIIAKIVENLRQMISGI